MKNFIYVVLGLSLALNGFAIYRHFQRKHQMQNCNQHCSSGGHGLNGTVQYILEDRDSIYRITDTANAKKDIRAFKEHFNTPITGAYIPKNLIDRIFSETAKTKFTGINVYYGLDGVNYNIYVEGNASDEKLKLEEGINTDCYKFFSYCPKSCGSLGQ